MFDFNVIVEYAIFLNTNKITRIAFLIEAVSSPMLFADEMVQFKEETKDVFLHFSNLLLFTILPVIFFSTPAWHLTEGRAPL